MALKKMKIIVLAGGDSTEREVSLISGHMVEKALREKGHEVEFMDLRFIRRPEEWGVILSKCAKFDIAFLALHGVPGEDGRLQAMLELAGIPYTGEGYLSSAICMDKVLTKKILREASLPVPAEYTLEEAGTAGFPLVVKTSTGGSSVGVYIVQDQKELSTALEEAKKYGGEVMLEQYIPGREFTLTVMDGKAMPIVEIIPKSSFYDYEHKYEPGATEEICPAKLPEEETKALSELAEKAYRALSLKTYARFDVRRDEGGAFYFLEANSLPGMTPTSLLPQEGAAMGMDFAGVCEKIIEVSLKKNEALYHWEYRYGEQPGMPRRD